MARGERLVELLKQGQYAPMQVEEQVVEIYAGTNGYLDGIPTKEVGRYLKDLMNYIDSKSPEILSSIRDEKVMSDEVKEKLNAVLKEYNEVFLK